MDIEARKRPLVHARDYAQAIVDAYPDVALQREIFARCPMELRPIARSMAKDAIARLEARTRAIKANRELHRQAAAADPAPLKPTQRISDLTKSSPEVGRARLAELRAALGHKEQHA